MNLKSILKKAVNYLKLGHICSPYFITRVSLKIFLVLFCMHMKYETDDSMKGHVCEEFRFMRYEHLYLLLLPIGQKDDSIDYYINNQHIWKMPLKYSQSRNKEKS